MLLLATKCVCAHYAVVYSALGGIAMSCTVGISITQASIVSIVSETLVDVGVSLHCAQSRICRYRRHRIQFSRSICEALLEV